MRTVIPFGFHGTQAPDRIDMKKDEFVNPNRNQSYGCINFRDKDIQFIDNFINYNQLSFWLSDNPNKIEKIPSGFFTPSSAAWSGFQ